MLTVTTLIFPPFSYIILSQNDLMEYENSSLVGNCIFFELLIYSKRADSKMLDFIHISV